ncbi:acyl-coenzyme A thioesterase 2, chloroplastic isoform X3 [Physcomitrium patens]|nr:acyl-coenzyme A thioesterase 9, mitochondrial-like isoform X3 [Physcomitrium patens]XP_024365858.1 acyl-coenzyme A thioesterase 9, mitochondrial-like isoform X3 [Physcomitrium patens]|eukprot:XP_024365857.1 acyl-coenzyme A thioesterase 9, mitochondrial-like isoform X3 [Physcomitrella patens]
MCSRGRTLLSTHRRSRTASTCGRSTLQSKTPAGNRTSVLYNFSSDNELREEYRNPWNSIRIGKLLEDLDALAGTIAVKHCSDSDHTTRPLLLVTASVDKISMKKRLRIDVDLQLAGAVAWVGRSSMEIRMEVIQPVREVMEEDDKALIANFTFVARDWKTHKAALVNHLVPQTEEEKQLFAMGSARDAHRKKLRLEHQEASTSPFTKQYNDRLAQLLREGRVLCEMPALADRNSILMRDTRLENAIICQPQQRNMHGRIFGGFLMRRAFEIAFSTAYVFGGIRPLFLEVDHVDFRRPVDVGDFLRLKSCVLYTETENLEQPRIHVEVIAHVTQPELKSSEVSNTFYFTFSLDPEIKAPGVDWNVRRVLPATEEEARTYLARYEADHIVHEVSV